MLLNSRNDEELVIDVICGPEPMVSGRAVLGVQFEPFGLHTPMYTVLGELKFSNPPEPVSEPPAGTVIVMVIVELFTTLTEEIPGSCGLKFAAEELDASPTTVV